MNANKKYHFYQNPKNYIPFHQKSQNAQFCPAARIEMSFMNSHLVENALANTRKYK